MTEEIDKYSDRGIGKPSAVAKAFSQYKSVLRSLIYRRLNRQADADDVLQETFVQAYKMEQRQPINHPKSYLYKTAANLILRENKKISHQLTDYMEDCEPFDLSSSEPSAFDHVAGRQELDALRQAIDGLPPQCRKVFLLRIVHEMSHAEIAEQMGLSVSTTTKHLAKALEKCDAYLRGLREKKNKAEPKVEYRNRPKSKTSNE